MLKKGLKILPGLLNADCSEKTEKAEVSKNVTTPRRNSYPDVTPNFPTSRPPISLPLDPITPTAPKKSHKKPTRMPNDATQKPFQDLGDPVLNNSVNIASSSSSKCTLNVNNDFYKMHAEKDMAATKPDQKLDPDEKPTLRRKPKLKVSPSGVQETTFSSSCNGQESVRKNKPKSSQNRSKVRSDRVKSSRKRQLLPDVEEPSPLMNLVFRLKVLLSQVPVQPLLSSLTETMGSLMGMAVGLLWVFAVLSYEWAQTLFQSVQKWSLLAWDWLGSHGASFIVTLFLRIPNDYYASSTQRGKAKRSSGDFSLPKTGEEAVQRLLNLKETDPYSILGITSDATDEDIKKSYKSQAILVHPDKNHFPGAEEAFKILASAFEIIGNTESRKCYDEEHVLSRPQSEASQEIAEFLEKLKQNIEEAQSFLGCQNCGKTHRRYRVDRTPSEARYCAACKDRHAAKEGDLWAETTMMGFKWHYYSYLDGGIFDVTEWVTCQPNLVSRVEANTHFVPCRLATPKNKNRSTAYSRMEDLKDLVNDLLNASQNAGTDAAGQRSAPPPQNSKMKAKRASTGRRKK